MSFLENREGVEHLKAACGLCAAKTGQSREEGFLPLWMHLLDTAGVMEKLFDLRIPLMIQNHLIRKCGSKERARGLFILTGLVHDIGKASSVFQEKIFHSGEIPFEFPLRFLNREEYGDPLLAHHSRLGMVILMKEGFHQALVLLRSGKMYSFMIFSLIHCGCRCGFNDKTADNSAGIGITSSRLRSRQV